MHSGRRDRPASERAARCEPSAFAQNQSYAPQSAPVHVTCGVVRWPRKWRFSDIWRKIAIALNDERSKRQIACLQQLSQFLSTAVWTRSITYNGTMAGRECYHCTAVGPRRGGA